MAHDRPHAEGDTSAYNTNQMNHYLDQCAFGYRNSNTDTYTIFFRREKTAKDFLGFVAGSYGKRTTTDSSPRMAIIGIEDSGTVYGVETTPPKWKKPGRNPIAFETDVDIWKAVHKDRWLGDDPSQEEIVQAVVHATAHRRK